MEASKYTSLPNIKGDRRAIFEQALAASVCFDYYGLERGGHHAVLRWLLDLGPQPCMMITQAKSPTPGAVWYHPSGWFTTAIAPPQSVALTYGPDSDVAFPHSRIDSKAVVLCVRDVRNLYASRLRWNHEHKRQLFRVDSASQAIWKNYARQALGDVDYFNGRCVPIVFDRWFVDEAYRLDVVDRLRKSFGWDLRDKSDYLHKISRPGGGSSFDKLDYEGFAQEMMGVLKRWKDYKGALEYYIDEDMLALNERLMGA